MGNATKPELFFATRGAKHVSAVGFDVKKPLISGILKVRITSALNPVFDHATAKLPIRPFGAVIGRLGDAIGLEEFGIAVLQGEKAHEVFDWGVAQARQELRNIMDKMDKESENDNIDPKNHPDYKKCELLSDGIVAALTEYNHDLRPYFGNFKAFSVIAVGSGFEDLPFIANSLMIFGFQLQKRIFPGLLVRLHHTEVHNTMLSLEANVDFRSVQLAHRKTGQAKFHHFND